MTGKAFLRGIERYYTDGYFMSNGKYVRDADEGYFLYLEHKDKIQVRFTVISGTTICYYTAYFYSDYYAMNFIRKYIDMREPIEVDYKTRKIKSHTGACKIYY